MRIFVLACLLALNGCTLLGASVGALAPTYEEVRDLEPSVGRTVRLYGPDGRLLATGRLDGYRDGTLLLEDARVPLANVMRAERQDGTRWLRGALIGLSIDATLALLLLGYSQMRLRASGFGFGS